MISESIKNEFNLYNVLLEHFYSLLFLLVDIASLEHLRTSIVSSNKHYFITLTYLCMFVQVHFRSEFSAPIYTFLLEYL